MAESKFPEFPARACDGVLLGDVVNDLLLTMHTGYARPIRRFILITYLELRHCEKFLVPRIGSPIGLHRSLSDTDYSSL